MKKLILILLCSASLSYAEAQKKAITENGREVRLYNDGTWKYLDAAQNQSVEIANNTNNFSKSDNAQYLLKSAQLNVGFWIDKKNWSFRQGYNNPDAEFELQLKDGDLYGMIIIEKIEVPLASLRNIALENGREAAPDLEIVKEEYRTVNGLKVLLLQMSGTAQGIKFTYYGYYYSNPKGTVQFITYTSTNLLEQYITDCNELLNGFVEVN